MQKTFTLKFNHMFKKINHLLCDDWGGCFAAASSGGGGDKRKSEPLKPEFAPLSERPMVSPWNQVLTWVVICWAASVNNLVTYNTLVTYQHGNTVYILPQQIKMNVTPASLFCRPLSTNLNLLDEDQSAQINLRLDPEIGDVHPGVSLLYGIISIIALLFP